MHVFNDLLPYICTFGNCDSSSTKFPSRAAWADHEFNEHRFDALWVCPECPAEHTSTLDWEGHLEEEHNRIFSRSELHVARISAYRQRPRPVESEECPLCRVILCQPRHAFIKHIGQHMEEIALIALPRETEQDSEEDPEADTEKGSTDTVNSSGSMGMARIKQSADTDEEESVTSDTN